MGQRKINRDKRYRYVYFFGGEQTGLVKIGVADCMIERIDRLQTGSPDPLVHYGGIASTRAQRLETELHTRFAMYREHGEWFRQEGALQRFVLRLMKEPEDDIYGVPVRYDAEGDPRTLPAQ